MASKQQRLPIDLDPDKLVQFTKNTWDPLTPQWNFWAQRWKRVLDFLRSQHWVGLKNKELQKQPTFRRYPVFDFTLNTYNDLMGRFLQGRVRYSTTPSSQDPEDIAAADMADAGLAYSWDILEMDRKRIELAAWLFATGNASTRVYWDTDTGRMIPLAIRGQDGQLIPVNPQTLKPDPSMGKPIMVDAGEVGLDVLSPQMVRYPKSKKQGVMVGMLMTQDEVDDRYAGDFAEILKFSPIDSQLDVGHIEGHDMPQDGVPRALVIEHYIPRSKKFPQGLWWTMSGDHILTKPRKLPAGVIPITKWEWIPLPGSQIAVTPLYGMTFANKMVDELSGKMWEWANRVVPKQLLAEGGGIEVGQMDDEVAQQVPYNPGGEPQWTVPPPVPPHLFQMRNDVIRDMQMEVGYQTSRPTPPPPGATPQLRQQQRPTGEGTELATLEHATHAAWQYQGRVVLSYMKTFYTPGRMIHTVGPDKLHQWRAFSQMDLQRLPTAVHLDKQALFSTNRQHNRDTVIGLMNTPASQVLFSDITPEGQPIIDKDRVEVAMQAVGIDVGIADLDPDIAEARNEHAMIMNGQQIEVRPHQNHPAHVDEHQRIMKGISYRSWPKEAQQALEQNIQQHQEALQQEQTSRRQAMLATEREMREIRGMADSAAKVRTALGEEFAEMFGEIIRSTLSDFFKEEKNDGKKADK